MGFDIVDTLLEVCGFLGGVDGNEGFVLESPLTRLGIEGVHVSVDSLEWLGWVLGETCDTIGADRGGQGRGIS